MLIQNTCLILPFSETCMVAMQVHLIFWFISAVSGAPLLCENVTNCTRLATSVADIITVRQSAGCCFHNDCEQGRWPVFLMNLISNPAQHQFPTSASTASLTRPTHACSLTLLFQELGACNRCLLQKCLYFSYPTIYHVPGYGKCDSERKMFQRRRLRGPESIVWHPNHCSNICKYHCTGMFHFMC